MPNIDRPKADWPHRGLIANHYRPNPALGFTGVGAACPVHRYRFAPMPRYFFNVHFDHHVARDPVGVEVADLAGR